MSTQADDITYSDYWREVRAIAEDIYNQTPLPYRVGDVIHEAIDGHRWVIYPHLARQVMRWTDSDDAIFDDGGDVSRFDNMTAFITTATACAMIQDVDDCYNRIEDEADEYARANP